MWRGGGLTGDSDSEPSRKAPDPEDAAHRAPKLLHGPPEDTPRAALGERGGGGVGRERNEELRAWMSEAPGEGDGTRARLRGQVEAKGSTQGGQDDSLIAGQWCQVRHSSRTGRWIWGSALHSQPRKCQQQDRD